MFGINKILNEVSQYFKCKEALLTLYLLTLYILTYEIVEFIYRIYIKTVSIWSKMEKNKQILKYYCSLK